MNLIIYGPEGSGKGTQAKLLSNKLNIPVYTSGDLVRESAQNDKGIIGEECRDALKSGTYVSDNKMYELWKGKLKKSESNEGFILDGFPRNVQQVEFLFKELGKYGMVIDKVVYIDIDDKLARERLLKRNRKIFEGSSISHDTIERINPRLTAYRIQEKALLSLFRQKNLLCEVNGSGTVEEIFGSILRKLNTKK